jgi:hypothetical protein
MAFDGNNGDDCNYKKNEMGTLKHNRRIKKNEMRTLSMINKSSTCDGGAVLRQARLERAPAQH